MSNLESSSGSSSSSTALSLARDTAERIGTRLKLSKTAKTCLTNEFVVVIQNVTRDVLANQKKMDERWKAHIRMSLEKVINLHLGA